jgi:NADPH2:quinone reductase
MKYIHIAAPGGPETLEVRETTTPEPRAGQVLIKVAAAGVNRLDILQRMGAYPPPPGASDIPGVEVAGEIVKIKGKVGTLHVGDRVCALLTGGGYAEYTLADAAACLPIPAGLSAIEAAGIPESFFTVWSNVFDRGGLKSGESFLVHGGSSGIGTTAIQLAHAFGATVFTTVGSEEKRQACLALGADHVINYREQDFVEYCQQATGKRGIHLILDMVGGDYFNRNIRIAAEEGRIVIIAALKGYKVEADLLGIMRKRLTVTGSTLRARPVTFKRRIAARLLQQVWPLLESGQIKPLIYKTFPLAKAADAHRLMETSAHIGKIVLTT